MITNFTCFLTESADSINNIESFFKDINKVGYSNPYQSNEFVILDDLGIEFKLHDNVVYIVSMKAYDTRKERIEYAFQNVIEIADANSLKVGINPFPFKESNLSDSELQRMYLHHDFKLLNGKWIKTPV